MYAWWGVPAGACAGSRQGSWSNEHLHSWGWGTEVAAPARTSRYSLPSMYYGSPLNAGPAPSCSPDGQELQQLSRPAFTSNGAVPPPPQVTAADQQSPPYTPRRPIPSAKASLRRATALQHVRPDSHNRELPRAASPSLEHYAASPTRERPRSASQSRGHLRPALSEHDRMLLRAAGWM